MSPYDDGWLYTEGERELARPLPARCPCGGSWELEGVTILQTAFTNIEERTAAIARRADPRSPKA